MSLKKRPFCRPSGVSLRYNKTGGNSYESKYDRISIYP